MNPINPQDDVSSANLTGRASATTAELQNNLEGLRDLFFYALIALIGLTLTLDFCFLGRQLVFARAQLEGQRPNVRKSVEAFKKETEPLMKNFTSSLQSFAATNQNFQPILNKYRLALGHYFQDSPVGSLQPAPAQPPGSK
jgi:hypothetical protein